MLGRAINIFIIFLCLAGYTHAQSFENPDLNGVVDGLFSLPTYWQSVPYNDVNCIANNEVYATPDLTNLEGPLNDIGINGNPYSGSTFVSGSIASDQTQGVEAQEGIMQEVTGFIPNKSYTIYFYQTVVKGLNTLDNSGSWAIYIDTNLAGISLPTYSDAEYNSNSLNWEERGISFTASNNTHLIKFLPIDDDLNLSISLSDTMGALRMGIDRITFTPENCDLILELPNIITPNNDGVNDFFKPINYKGVTPLHTIIFNRWGEIVFETRNPLINWNGNRVSNGVYFYIIKYYDCNGTIKDITGNLTVLK